MSRRSRREDGTAFMDVLSNAKIVVFVMFVVVAAVNSLERIAAIQRPDTEKGHRATEEATLTNKPVSGDLIVLQIGVDVSGDVRDPSIGAEVVDEPPGARCEIFRGRDHPGQWLVRKEGDGGEYILVLKVDAAATSVRVTVAGTRGGMAIPFSVKELHRRYGGGWLLLTIGDRSSDGTGIIVG